jgi:hypothetical protein
MLKLIGALLVIGSCAATGGGASSPTCAAPYFRLADSSGCTSDCTVYNSLNNIRDRTCVSVCPIGTVLTSDTSCVGEFRLVEDYSGLPSPYLTFGRLEVSIAEDEWGTVCASQATDVNVVRVACRSIGLLPANSTSFETATTVAPSAANRRIALRSLMCDGIEDTLHDCGYTADTALCTHAQDAYVECAFNVRLTADDGSDASDSGVGRLEVYADAQRGWGTVCATRFSVEDAIVACRQMGQSGSTPAFWTAPASARSDMPVVLSGLDCDGTEPFLDRCSFDNYHEQGTCPHARDIFVDCTAAVTPVPVPPALIPATETEFQLVRFDGSVANSTGNEVDWDGDGLTYVGRLETRLAGETEFKTVCSNGFDVDVARFACHSLMRTTEVNPAFHRASHSNGVNASASPPTRLACTGASSVDNGTVTPMTCFAIDASDCTHDDDVILSCAFWQQVYTAPPRRTEVSSIDATNARFDYRLTDLSGRLEIRSANSSEWGTACVSDFDDAAAVVACRSAGRPTESPQWLAVSASKVTKSGPIVGFSNIQCQGNETFLDGCEHTHESTTCRGMRSVRIDCAPRWDYRLVGGSATTGRLEVRPNATVPWGTVCADTFDERAGLVACRALGFAEPELRHIVVASALDNPVGSGLAVQPIWLTGFDCTGAELNIEMCNATLIDYSPSCSHHQDVILTCSHMPADSPAYELELPPDDSFRSDGPLRILPEPECLSFEQSAAANACRSVGYAIDMYAQYEILDALVDADNSTDCLPYTNTSLHLQCYPMWPKEEATPLYRLEAEERSGRGRLAVQLPPSNQWGSVCSTNFGPVDAAAACRSLGYSGIGAIAFTAPASTHEFLVGNLGCHPSTADASFCPWIESPQRCDHDVSEVGVDCTIGDFQFRLLPLDRASRASQANREHYMGSSEGVLQFRQNASTAWGPVCYQGVTTTVAVAACRQLFGPRRVVGGFSPTPVLGDADTALQQLECRGTFFDTLTNGLCDFTLADAATSSLCNTGVYLSCSAGIDYPAPTALEYRLVENSTQRRGVLQTRPRGSAQEWGFICGANPSENNADLACAALNLPITNASLYNPGVPPSLHGPVYFDSSTCDNTSTSLTRCLTSYMRPPCGYDTRLAVDCAYDIPPKEAIVPSFRLVEAEGHQGFRFEMRPTPSSQWGTVCSKHWTTRDARVACRAATGEPSPIAAVLYSFTPAPRRQPIHRRGFACRGNEADPTLCPLSTDSAADDCTHEDDLHVICGSSDALSGCSGPQDCREWSLVEYNLVPNCPTLASLDAPVGATLDHSECRRLAAQSDADSSEDIIPAYVMSNDYRRCAIFRCPLNPNRRSGEDFSLISFGDANAPTSLYAKVRSISASLGLCTRPLSCNGRGVATLETVMTYDTATAAIINTPKCSCSCDEGYAGPDCSTFPSMNHMPDHVVVRYTTTDNTPLDSDELEAFADNMTSLVNEPGLAYAATHEGVVSEGYRLVVRALATPPSDGTKRAGVLRLLALQDHMIELMAERHTGVEVKEIAPPSRGLTRRRAGSVHLTALNNDDYPSTSPVTAPELGPANFIFVDGVRDSEKVDTETIRTVRISIANALAVESVSSTTGSRIRLTSASFSGACTPITTAPQLQDHPCGYRAYCDIETPSLPISEALTIQIEGVLQACDGSVPVTAASLEYTVIPELTWLLTTSLRLEYSTNIHESTHASSATTKFTFSGIMLLTIASCLGVVAIGLFVVLMSAFCNCGVARDIGVGRRIAVIVVVVGSYALCGIFAIYGLTSFNTIGREWRGYGVAFVDWYYTPLCSASEVSYAPNHVTPAVPDGACHLAHSYGTPALPFWLRANCLDSGKSEVAFGETEDECVNADSVAVEPAACVSAGAYAAFLAGQYFQVACISLDFTPKNRLYTIESVLDPVPRPTVETRVLPAAPGGFAFQSDDIQHAYFSIGGWLSRASAFGFFGGTAGSSVALSTLSDGNVWAGQAGTPLDLVTFDTRETPPSFSAALLTPTVDFTSAQHPRPGFTSEDISIANASLPEDPMSAYGPLFNGFDSSQPSSPDRHGAGAMRLYGIAGSVLDFGGFNLADHGITVTFWMRASNATRGYVFLATDAWTDEEGATPIAERLTAVLDTPSRTFFDRTWTAYSATFADGAQRTLKFAYRRPLNLGGDGDVLVFDDPDVVGGIFDDAWHFIAFTMDLDRGRTRVQIFVDGRSSYLGNGYQACMQEGRSFPAVRELPSIVAVTNPYMETVRDGGVAYIGHLNAGVYAFTVHDEVLTHVTIVNQLGTPSMRAHASIDVSNSRLAGAGFVVVFIAGIALTCAQTYLEFRAEDEKDVKVAGTAPAAGGQGSKAQGQSGAAADDNAQQADDCAAVAAADDAGQEVVVGSASGAAVTSQRGLQQLAVVIPTMMQVCQNMTLYFDGMEWPKEFQLTLGWVYFPFSVDIFNFFPSIPLWIALAAQFGIAVLALLFLLKLRGGDSARFDDNVVQHCEENGLDIDRVKMRGANMLDLSEKDAAVLLYFNTSDHAEGKQSSIKSASEQDSNLAESLANEATRRRARRQLLAGLPNPQVDMEASKQSVLEFKINGQKVAGLISRVAIQNTITACLRETERSAPPLPSHESDNDAFLAVVLRPEHEDITLSGFKGLRERKRAINQLASLPTSLQSKLELCGFADISTVPTPSQPLLEIIRDCDSLQAINPTKRRHLNGDQLATVVDSVNLNYALAAVLPSAAREIVDRCMEMRRTSLVDRLRGSSSPDPNVARKLDRLRDLAERFPMITYYRVTDRLRCAADTVIAEGVTVKRVLDLVRRPADAFDVFYGLEQVVTNAKAKHQPIMTLLSAARAAGAPIPNMIGARAAGATAVEWEYLETIRVLAGCFQAYDDDTRALIIQLFFIMNPSIAEDSYKTKYTEQRHDLERIATRAREIFIRRLTEVQTRVDFNYRVLQSAHIVYGYVRPAPNDVNLTPVFYSVDPTNPETYATPTQLTLAIQPELPRCPVHRLRLIAAVPEVHDLVRQRLMHVDDNVYPCAHRNNLVFQLFCSEHRVNKVGDIVLEGCNELDYKVCPDDSCNFSICNNCAHGGIGDRLAAFIARRQYLIRRYGLATTLGLLFIVAAQAMYQPAVKGAVIAIFCHSTLLCEFPDCYNPATPMFLALAIGSAVVLLMFGLGLFWMFLSVVWDRKEAILRSSALRNHLMKHPVLPCFDPQPHDPGQDVNYGDIFLVSADAVGYASLLREDTSLFRGLYEQYEFRWMCVHPFTFVFKIAIVCVVLYAGEPNTLRVILLSGLVELVQLVFYLATEPFTDPWLDILAKGGSLHQVIQLGLICLHRADSYEDPDKNGAAYAMIFFATVYLILVLVVLAIVVVIPAVRQFLASRQRQKEERERVREERQKRQEAALAQKNSKRLEADAMNSLLPAADSHALLKKRSTKLKSASETVLRHHFLESDEFSFSLSQPDAYVLAAKGGRLIGDVVASPYDDLTRGGEVSVESPLVITKKGDPLLDADASSSAQDMTQLCTTSSLEQNGAIHTSRVRLAVPVESRGTSPAFVESPSEREPFGASHANRYVVAVQSRGTTPPNFDLAMEPISAVAKAATMCSRGTSPVVATGCDDSVVQTASAEESFVADDTGRAVAASNNTPAEQHSASPQERDVTSDDGIDASHVLLPWGADHEQAAEATTHRVPTPVPAETAVTTEHNDRPTSPGRQPDAEQEAHEDAHIAQPPSGDVTSLTPEAQGRPPSSARNEEENVAFAHPATTVANDNGNPPSSGREGERKKKKNKKKNKQQEKYNSDRGSAPLTPQQPPARPADAVPLAPSSSDANKAPDAGGSRDGSRPNSPSAWSEKDQVPEELPLSEDVDC